MNQFYGDIVKELNAGVSQKRYLLSSAQKRL